MEASPSLFELEPARPPVESAGVPALSFVVHGSPEPAGSKKAVPMGRGPGARWGVVDANPKARRWKDLVAQQAGEAMAGRELLRGPLEISLWFYLRRPKGHFGKHGLLTSAPAYPMVRPDVLKLARGVEDSLSGVVYTDDSQIVVERLEKLYGSERVEITVRELLP